MTTLRINIGHSITVDGFFPDSDLDICYDEIIVDQLSTDKSSRAKRKGFSGHAFDYHMANDPNQNVVQYSIRNHIDEQTFIRVAIALEFLKEGDSYWVTTRKFNKFGHRKIVAIHFEKPPHFTPWP